jgi:protocatechuate 3,4-dioxygenase beta subunit
MNMKLKQLFNSANNRGLFGRSSKRSNKQQILRFATRDVVKDVTSDVVKMEPLEDRQMMSLTVNVDVGTSGKSANVTSVGQVVDLNVYVTVTGTTKGTNDGFQSLCGSFLGTETDGNYSVGGNINNVNPTFLYTANGAQSATSQDLNGDGYNDAGSNNNSDIAGFFNARGGAIETNGTVSGDSQTFLIGTMTYTVVSLNYGQPTDINFRLRDGIPSGAYDAVWLEDGQGENDSTDSVLTGAPVVITDTSLTPPPDGSISGTVDASVNGSTKAVSGEQLYIDQNNSGSYVSGDPLVSTNSGGYYDFTGLHPGTYHIRQILTAGEVQTAPSTTPLTVTLSAGQNVSGQDFLDAASGSVSGTVTKVIAGSSTPMQGVQVYADVNNNGVYNTGDPTGITDSNGNYTIGGLGAGQFTIREVVPSGYAASTSSASVTVAAGQSVAGVNFTDTSTAIVPASISGNVTKIVNGVSSPDSGVTLYLDLNDTGSLASGDPTAVTDGSGNFSFTGLTPNSYLLRQVVPSGFKQTSPLATPTLITVGSGDVISNENFVDTGSTVAQTGSIAGTVYKVVNGVTSADSGVTVFLDTNNDGVLDSGDVSTTTSSTGTYSFTGLAAGTYHLREVVASGYSQTSPGSSPTNINLLSGQSVAGENFTDTASVVNTTGSISGTVYKVVSGVTSVDPGVTVYLDTNNDGVLDTGDISTVTGSNGTYSFTGLASTTFHLRQVVPTGYSQTSPSSSPTSIPLATGQSVTGQNFTDTAATVNYIPGSIAGEVYNDKNGNGKLDSGETGISGVELYIDLNKDGTIDSGDPTTTTSSAGTYSFTGLAPGTYRVREVVPTGDKLTDPLPAVGYFDIVVQSNWQIHGENWGNTVPVVTSTGSITGTVYSDANKNGKLDSGEIGIPNVTVYIDLKKDGKDDSGDPTAVTNASGVYTFSGLAAGSYVVRETLPSGDSLTSTSSLTATVTSGGVTSGQNFGNYGAITLSGNVFNDANGNGVKDSGEAGLSGWVVYCDLKNTGSFVTSDNNKTTDSNGNFDFVSLTAGTYIIRVIPKSGYTLTSPSSGFYSVTIAPGVQTVTPIFAEHA